MKLDKEKILDEIHGLEWELKFLSELSYEVEGFKIKPALNPRECLFEASILVKEGREKEALGLLLNCKCGIEATLTFFLRRSWEHFESRLKKLRFDEPSVHSNPDILNEVISVLNEEKRCVTSEGKLDIEEAVELYSKAMHVLRHAVRELRLKSSPLCDEKFSDRWRRFSVAENLCKTAEMLPS